MNEQVAAALKKYHDEQKKYESKQLVRESLRRRKSELEGLRESQELSLVERKDKTRVAIDAAARGEISQETYKLFVENQVAGEKELAETAQFIESVERQLLELDSDIFTGQGPFPQDVLAVDYPSFRNYIHITFARNPV